MALMWRSKDDFGELVPFLHHKGCRDQAQVIRLGSKFLQTLTHLKGSEDLGRGNP